VTIAEVKGLGGPNQSMSPIEVTNVDSAGWREFIGGLKDAGEVTFQINFIPNSSQHRQLLADLGTDPAPQINYRIEFNNTAGSILLFPKCLVTNFSVTEELESSVMASITLRPSGQPTWTV